MTKKLLLAAAAVSVIGFAGAASAQVQISGAKVSGQALGINAAGSTTNTFFTLAAESNGTEANRTTTAATGDNVIASTLKVGRFDAGAGGTNYTATITLTGATFATPVLNSFVTTTGQAGNCTVSAPTVVSGGAKGQNTATVVFNVGTGCSSTTAADYAPNGVNFDVPFIKDAVAGNVSATVSYAVATTGAAFGGAAASADLVRVANGYSVFARPTLAASPTTSNPTTFALPSYTALATGGSYDNVIGSIGATTATPAATAAGNVIHANMAGAALPVITGQAVVNGNLAVLTPTAGALTLTVNEGKTSAAMPAAATLAATDIVVAKAAGQTNTPVTAPQAFTATVTPTLASNTLVNALAPVTGSLETVGQQGTSFVAPWVQSANPNYNTVIRVSNAGAAVAGVRLSLSSPAGTATATQCTAAELPKLASIPANGELAINSTDLTTCFGEFVRGDVRVTIPALTTNLTAKLRIVNPGNVVSEQSLGAFASGATTTN